MKEVLLKETVEHLGQRGEVVKVADGYARNYLLPRKLALPVTASNQRQIERERSKATVLEAEDRKIAEALGRRIAAAECILERRVGEAETLYGSVTAADIAEHLASQQLEVDKRKIRLGEPLKVLGERMVPVTLHRDVTVELKVRVVKQEVAETAEAGEAPVTSEDGASDENS